MKIGSVVKLKSGGPNMTIVGYRDASAWFDEIFTCAWIDKQDEEHFIQVPRDSLNVV